MEEHHIIPDRYGGSDADGNIVVLCASCHRALERIYTDEVWAATGLIPSEGTVTEFAEKALAPSEAADPIPKSELYAEYTEWCDRADVPVASQNKFTRVISDHEGVETGRRYIGDADSSTRCFIGVRSRLS